MINVTLITAPGTSLGEDDYENCVVVRLLLMAMPMWMVVIRILIMTFFFRYMELILCNLFLAQPPLFLVKKGKQEKWAFTEEDAKIMSPR